MKGPNRVFVVEYTTLDELKRKLEAELWTIRQKLNEGSKAIVEDLLRDIGAHPCEYLRTYRWPVFDNHLLVPEEWLVEQVKSPIGKALKGKYQVVERNGKWWVVMPTPLPKECLEEFQVFKEACEVARKHGKVVPIKGAAYVVVEARIVRRFVEANAHKLTKILAKWGIEKRQVMINRVRKHYYLFPPYLL